MEPSSLALRFNEVSTALRPLGHLIVVRRARELLGQGRFDDSVVFLSEAARRLSVRELTGLANDVRSWIHARGDISALLDEHHWIVGSELDDLIRVEMLQDMERASAVVSISDLSRRELKATEPVAPTAAAALLPPPIPEEESLPVQPLEEAKSGALEPSSIIVPEVIYSSSDGGLPTGPLVAGIIMLQVLVTWFTLFWPY